MSADFVIFVFSLIALLVSGGFAVRSVTRLAQTLRLGEFFAGFIFVAFATSIPELIVGIEAARQGTPELSLGNVLGSNIANMTLIAGLLAVLAGMVRLKKDALRRDIWLSSFFGLLPFILIADGVLTRFDAAALILSFFGYLALVARESRVFSKRLKGPLLTGCGAAFFSALLAIGVLIIASNYAVSSGVSIAQTIGIPAVVIGLIALALGTSLPELVFSVKAARMGSGDVAVGNILGSTVANVTVIVGVTALIAPIAVEEISIYWRTLAATIVVFALFAFVFRKQAAIHRLGGGVLITVYLLYLISTLM